MLAATAIVQAPAAIENSIGKSYAVVIGIGHYPSSQWPDLTFARKDAEGMATILRNQGFEVTTLYDEQATARQILMTLEDRLAPLLRPNDRILFFFSGHGHTQTLSGRDFGYLVPYDGGENFASLVSMELLHSLSNKMDAAKHQVFIIDACFGGQFAPAKSVPGIRDSHPNYIEEITRRRSRQFLTAGGKNQQVLDGGPEGYSYFTGYLLQALRDGLGDLNGDGYITMNELTTYLVPLATNKYQTPGAGTLPGHGLGEFVFFSPSTQVADSSNAGPVPSSGLGIKGTGARARDTVSPLTSITVPPTKPQPDQIAVLPPPPSAARERLERFLTDERDELARDLGYFVTERGIEQDVAFTVMQIWKASIVDTLSNGFVVSIHYDAVINPLLNEYASRTQRFRVQMTDGDIKFLELLGPD